MFLTETSEWYIDFFSKISKTSTIAHSPTRKQNSFLKERFVEAGSGTTLKQLSWVSSLVQWRNYLRMRSSRHNFETSAGWLTCFKPSDIYGEALITEEELHGVFAELQNWGDCVWDLRTVSYKMIWSNLKMKRWCWRIGGNWGNSNFLCFVLLGVFCSTFSVMCGLRLVCICMARPFFWIMRQTTSMPPQSCRCGCYMASSKHQLDTVKGSHCHCWRG